MMNIAEKRCAEKYFEFTLVRKDVDMDTKRKIFMLLSDIYLLDSAAAESLFAKCEHKDMVKISDVEKLRRQKRLNQFFAETGKKAHMSSELNELLDIKGNAIYALQEEGITKEGKDGTSDTNLMHKLMQAADLGMVDAMFMAAIANIEGIAAPQNLDVGRRYLRRLSHWIDVNGMMLCLYYDKKTTAELMSKLYTLTRGLSEADLYNTAKERYCIYKDIENKSILFLKKAIAADDKAKPSIYSSSLAHVTFSEILSDVDKQKILFAPDSELFNAATSMPLDLPKRASAPAVGEIETHLGRKTEQKKVCKIITSEAIIGANKVCFTCGDTYVLRDYMQAIKAADSEDNVQIVKLSEISENGLSLSPMNVFLRAVDEKKTNLFLVEIDNSCPSLNMEYMQDILDDTKRAHFSLSPLRLELDLSSLIFILFCHDSVKSKLRNRVFDVALSDISKTERAEFISEMVKTEEGKWGVNFESGAVDALETMDLDKAHRIIRYVAQASFFEDKQTISDKAINECYMKALGSNASFGFGERSK